jgi:soluble lytic murein transglycosylase-like protein
MTVSALRILLGMEPMKDSKTILYLWRPRSFWHKCSGTYELSCGKGNSGVLRLYDAITSGALADSRTVPAQAHSHGLPRRRYRAAIGVLACLLAAVASYWYVDIRGLEIKPGDVEGQLLKIESWRAAGIEGFLNIHVLVDRLLGHLPRSGKQENHNLQQGEILSKRDVLIREEIVALLKEFGAEEYSVPPEFMAGVDRFITQLQERDHEHLARALGAGRADLERIREILAQHNLPQDLAYMVLVESGFLHSSESQDGAVGLWQFTEVTARNYGMEVTEDVDDRLDLSKSTVAASRYLRDLILDFGTGSSVMLAMAAYNGGAERVRRAVRSLKDPIKQRNFWHLYRTGMLPEETREYVPKVIAATIIGRNPERFGFLQPAMEREAR